MVRVGSLVRFTMGQVELKNPLGEMLGIVVEVRPREVGVGGTGFLKVVFQSEKVMVVPVEWCEEV